MPHLSDNAAISPIRLAALGDLLLACSPDGSASGYGPFGNLSSMLSGLRSLLSDCDVVFGNLECTLAGRGAMIAAEPRAIATPELVRWVRSAGFTVVTLANNHAFDCLQPGFRRVRNLLDELGIAWFGAGEDLAEARRPAIVEVRGLRLGFLGAVDPSSGPSHLAGPGQFGVVPLDVDRLADDIRCLRGQVDHVIVSLHWGEERLLIPSPRQIEQARQLAEAGAALVLGHHPHVVQGLEVHRGVPIIYSLGNFIASEVPFTNGDRVTWNRSEQTGCLLLADLVCPTSDRPAVSTLRQVPTWQAGAMLQADASGFGDRRIARVNRALDRGVTPGRYRRQYLWVKTVRPALRYLRWSKLKTLRPRHFARAMASIIRAHRAW